jgi:hypothetical protein
MLRRMTRREKMTKQIGLRLEPELYEEIEEWAASIRPKPPTATAARELIIEGLASFKRKAEGAEKPKKPR